MLGSARGRGGVEARAAAMVTPPVVPEIARDLTQVVDLESADEEEIDHRHAC